MPRYRVTDPESGRTLTLTGDSPPSEAELEEIFAKVGGGAPAANPAASAPAPAAAPPQEGLLRKAGRILLPNTAEYTDKNGADVSLGKLGAMAKDVVSFPKRAWDAAAVMHPSNPGLALDALANNKSRGAVDDIAREAPLMFTPGGMVRGATGAKRIGSAVVAGLKEAMPSVAYHQAESISEGEGASGAAAAAELATGGLLRGGFQGLAEGAKRIVLPVKTGVSKLSEVSQEALQEASDPNTGAAALERFKAAGRRFGTDDGVNVMPIAEDLGERVKGANAQRINLAEGSRAQQVEQFEESLIDLRRDATGGKARRIGGISSTAQGDQIKETLTHAKGPLQDRYAEGDKAAYGGLRDKPALTRQVKRIEIPSSPLTMKDPETGELVETMAPGRREVVENIPVLPERIDEVLSRYKAGPDSKGTRAISAGGVKAINSIKQLAAGAQTIDDLVNVRREVRRLQAAGQFEGAVFDKDLDDRALAQVLTAVRDVEKESIRKAAPRKAAQIIAMVDANDALYGRTLEALRKSEQRFGPAKTQGIISKIKEMDIQEVRALKKEAETNEVLAPVLHELQNGFVDDLILSASKDGQVSPKAFAKEWANLGDDLKTAWLKPEWISRIDDAVAKGTAEIKDPEAVGKALFGSAGDVFMAERKLSNIDSEAQKKALSELQMLDALFGSEYTQDAINAYRAKQLQIGKKGELHKIGNIRTGKASALGQSLGTSGIGAAAGAAVGGPLGVVVGAGTGAAAGLGSLYLQSPAGALMMFRALNRLETPGAGRATAGKLLNQGARSATFGKDDDGE